MPIITDVNTRTNRGTLFPACTSALISVPAVVPDIVLSSAVVVVVIAASVVTGWVEDISGSGDTGMAGVAGALSSGETDDTVCAKSWKISATALL